MLPKHAPQIELLGKKHDRSAFSCGEPALDRYIKRQASQDVRRRIAQVFVAVGDAPQLIAGYYSLSAASFSKREMPEQMAKKLPHYLVPAAIIGRLAVDRSYQGKGIGTFMLMDALRRVLQASEVLAVFAVVVDAKDDNAKRFYQQFGFLPFGDAPQRLFLPLQTIAEGWQKAR